MGASASTNKDQFDKSYPTAVIPQGMVAVSVTINFKSKTHELQSEETPIYLTFPRYVPSLAKEFLVDRMLELTKQLPRNRKKVKKDDPKKTEAPAKE